MDLNFLSMKQVLLALFALQTFVCLTSAELRLSLQAVNAFLNVHNKLRKETAPCKDSYPACGHWAKKGDCQNNPRWMNRNYKRSCRQCPCEPGCRDHLKTCKFWSVIGECDRNAGFMNSSCKKSCGNCLCGAGMPLLKWSHKLAKYAARRVNRCVYKHDPKKKYGENIFSTSVALNDIAAAKQSSKAWGEEIAYVDRNWRCAFGKTAKSCGHYSQQIWKDTTHVGCAANYCYKQGTAFTYVFCEYEPKGNQGLYDTFSGKMIYYHPY